MRQQKQNFPRLLLFLQGLPVRSQHGIQFLVAHVSLFLGQYYVMLKCWEDETHLRIGHDVPDAVAGKQQKVITVHV